MMRETARRAKSMASCLHFVRLPILRGELRGCRWTLSSRGKLGRVLLGSYEPAQTRMFRDLVRPGDVVFDVGANVGYYSLLSSRLVGASGFVVALEPAGHNLFHLRKNLSINGCRNVQVMGEAAGPEAGRVRFTADHASGTGTGRVLADGGVEVAQCRLDDVVERSGLRPTLIKIDVEGAELGVLQGTRHTLLQLRPRILLSTHGRDVHRRCLRFLEECGYRFEALDGLAVEDSFEVLCAARATVLPRVPRPQAA